jgi:putative DNA methylase
MTNMPTAPDRKKLIEVALPLDAINKASAREKSIRHGHPSTLHLWWARRPLAACRAVLFASLVDDPSSHPDEFPTEEAQEQERDRLFRLMEALVQWENSNNQEVLAQARAEILKSTGGNPPPVLDPFAGGGSIPLEAQRLGLEAHASDLNPVAVLINKALIEIPPKFANRPPVNPEASHSLMGRDWHGAQGLADDIRYYGKWMRDEAERRIGHLYPKVILPKEYGGGEATVIAWIWARTVTCPNPACGAQMSLVSSFWLSKKKGKEAWVEPEIDRSSTPPVIRFIVKTGKGQPSDPTKVGRGGQFQCLCCGNVASEEYIKNEGMNKRMGSKLMAIVAEGKSSRVYLAPTSEQENIAIGAKASWKPEQDMPRNPRWFSPPAYGMPTFGDIFTSRQLVALTTFSDLIYEAGALVQTHSNEDRAYTNTIKTYLALALDKALDRNTALCTWEPGMDRMGHTFTRQALPMVWDYVETNPFANAGGDLQGTVQSLCEVLDKLELGLPGSVQQLDAIAITKKDSRLLISTDPPYYDNIGYADLSDFFYVWLRRSLHNTYPDLFGTLLVPKAQELVAMPFRFGGSKSKAQAFFETGLEKAFEGMRSIQHTDYPLTVYYAFKQTEAEGNDSDEESSNGNGKTIVASTGWETMLEGLIRAGFTITGTWPMRTELLSRSIGRGTNALASSIVLVCRPRPIDAAIASRRQFLNELRAELPDALKKLQHGSIAPVDLAQASIGPGMAVYSRYSKVVESDGTPLRVRTALQLINRTLDEILTEQEGEYDAQTRWAIAWFEQFGMNAGEYGVAETLSKAKDTSLQGLVEAGLLEARAGKVRLRKREELDSQWNPRASQRLTVWEVMQRMIHALMEGEKGEVGAGDILREVGEKAEMARDLAYRLYTVCERKGWAQEALAYNSLVTSWSEISRLAHRQASDTGLWEATYLA